MDGVSIIYYLARQVMILNGGEIEDEAGKEGGTVVSLIFQRKMNAPAGQV